jgi:hypothetical protein
LAAVFGVTDSEDPIAEAYQMFAIGTVLKGEYSFSELKSLRARLTKPEIDQFDAHAAEVLPKYEEMWEQYAREKARQKREG